MTTTTTPTVTGTSPRRSLRLPVGDIALGVLGILTVVAVLEILPRTGLVNPAYLPPASTIFRTFVELLGDPAFWTALGDTLRGWAIGLAIAMVARHRRSAWSSAAFRFLRELTASTIEFLRPIPSVALIPLAVLLFGTELGQRSLLVVYASFWQVLVQVLYGVADVDPVARDTARSYRLGPCHGIRHVVWPTALPYVMTGFRLAAAVALILDDHRRTHHRQCPGLGQGHRVSRSPPAPWPTMYALSWSPRPPRARRQPGRPSGRAPGAGLAPVASRRDI